jgi:hypothetical protein
MIRAGVGYLESIFIKISPLGYGPQHETTSLLSLYLNQQILLTYYQSGYLYFFILEPFSVGCFAYKFTTIKVNILFCFQQSNVFFGIRPHLNNIT